MQEPIGGSMCQFWIPHDSACTKHQPLLGWCKTCSNVKLQVLPWHKLSCGVICCIFIPNLDKQSTDAVCFIKSAPVQHDIALCVGEFSPGTLVSFLSLISCPRQEFPNALILVLNRPLTLTKCREWLMEMCLNRSYFSSVCKLERVLLSAICKKHFSVCWMHPFSHLWSFSAVWKTHKAHMWKLLYRKFFFLLMLSIL